MATVFNQTISCRFGVELADLFADDRWTRFDVAVAWVRRSGIRHLVPTITEFLQRGGEARIVVGIDIENTSKEGLDALLALRAHGNIQTFIHHNEHQSVTFHPKVYVFSNARRARLIIGSNNLTESGLYTNTETGLQVDARVNDTVIVQMRAAIDSWCSTTGNLARPLDVPLLAQLEANGYVATEDVLQRRRASTRRATAGGRGTPRVSLFGSWAVSAPPPPAGTTPAPAATTGAQTTARPRSARRRSTAPTSGIGSVLLIRPRLARMTQMQLPKALRTSPFLVGVTDIISDHDGTARLISETHPGGNVNVNTYKMELPEGRGIASPVMRIWRTDTGTVVYRVYDASTPDGSFIFQRLEEGRHTNPPMTTVTKPSKPNVATWYRFI